MHDHTASVRACKDCGEQFVRWADVRSLGGTAGCRCHPCYLAYWRAKQRKNASDGQRKPRAYKSKRKYTACVVCSIDLTGGQQKYCAPCAKSERNRQERERGRPLSNWTRPCQCGVVFTAQHRNPYCSSECPARPRKAARTPKSPPPPKLCEDCGATITAARKRCAECSRLKNINRITSLYWIASANIEIRKAQAWRYEIVAYLRERDGDKCGICDERMLFDVKTGPNGDDRGATIDHVVPRSRGGLDDLTNLQLAHWSCNRRKGNRGGGEQLRLVG